MYHVNENKKTNLIATWTIKWGLDSDNSSLIIGTISFI